MTELGRLDRRADALLRRPRALVVVPANHKWYRDLAAAEILVAAARHLDPQWPEPKQDLSSVVISE